MAALGPLLEMVSNDRPMLCFYSLLNCSSLSAPSNSLTGLWCATCQSSQAKYSTKAAPSLTWHSRIPCCSRADLTAFSYSIGCLPTLTGFLIALNTFWFTSFKLTTILYSSFGRSLKIYQHIKEYSITAK